MTYEYDEDEDEPRIRDILRRRIARRWLAFKEWVRYSVLRRARPVAKEGTGSVHLGDFDKMLKDHYRDHAEHLFDEPSFQRLTKGTPGPRRWVNPVDTTKTKP